VRLHYEQALKGLKEENMPINTDTGLIENARTLDGLSSRGLAEIFMGLITECLGPFYRVAQDAPNAPVFDLDIRLLPTHEHAKRVKVRLSFEGVDEEDDDDLGGTY
jgi:hypothetical protein